jgi:hypothetical protein
MRGKQVASEVVACEGREDPEIVVADLMMLTRRWERSSMKRPSIWPRSAALPWE